MRIVGLIGPSFCGSTAVSVTLASLEHVITPGEVHWLIDPPEGRTWKEVLCYRHKQGCPCIPPDLWKRGTPQNAYKLLAELIDPMADVLVSSDKSRVQFDRYEERPSLYIVLTREIGSHVASLARTTGNEYAALEILCMFYERELENLDAPCMHISLEHFAQNPRAGLEWLATHTFFPHPTADPVLNDDYCHIGDNPSAFEKAVLDPSIPRRRTSILPRSLFDRSKWRVQTAISKVATARYP